MNEIRAIIDELLSNYGTDIHSDRRRFVALLKDYLPRWSHHWGYRLLILSVQAGLLDKLIAQAAVLPANLLLENHSRALSESYQIMPDAARWTIETWIHCFELNLPPAKRKKRATAPPQVRKPPPLVAAAPMPKASVRPVAITPVAPPTADQRAFRNGLGMEFVRIDPGHFRMGSPLQETDRDGIETPHEVSLSRTFYLQATTVTQDQWLQVMGTNPSDFSGGNLPVEKVSWDLCQQFIAALSRQEPFRYRLPTEAEWEYAARAGSSGAYFFGQSPARLEDYAWIESNAGGKTHPVATRAPSPWGLYDLYGNVREWCSDWYGPYGENPQQDPAGPAQGSTKICRGGSFKFSHKSCRSASRQLIPPRVGSNDLGLRLVLEL
ncbi:MAG: formylglycine-generating enzyme family protein [Candidatus Sericytochromatia bacterium]